jgi:membrane-bound lytic murein transglycosylase D
MLVKAGSTLLVLRSAHKSADVPEQVADNAMILLAPDRPPGRRVSFKAGKGGDSVAAVARRHGVSAAQVAQWNGIDADARFKPGQTIVVMKPAAAKAGPRKASTVAAKSGTAKAPVRRSASAKTAPKPANAKVATTRGSSKL